MTLLPVPSFDLVNVASKKSPLSPDGSHTTGDSKHDGKEFVRERQVLGPSPQREANRLVGKDVCVFGGEGLQWLRCNSYFVFEVFRKGSRGERASLLYYCVGCLLCRNPDVGLDSSEGSVIYIY